MKKIIIIAVVLVALLGAGIYFFAFKKPNTPTDNYINSGEVNTAKFDEYFRSIYLGKIGLNENGNYTVPSVTAVFETGKDQYCTVLEAKKQIPSGSYASAIYDTKAKSYARQKTVYPGMFSIGTTSGCGNIPVPAGEYEYKAYLNNTLVSVFPFIVK